jgi:5-methyltetrahydrofolate--homocysteine methyltransferase
MQIIGELINASRKTVAAAIEAQNSSMIQELAKNQAEKGANYIDINAGIFVKEEATHLKWLVTNAQAAVDLPCCIDSPDPKAIEAALSVHNGTPMINSISLEKSRFESLLSLVAGTDFKVVALCMSDGGMPETEDERLNIAEKLINSLLRNNLQIENIFVDPLVQPVSTNKKFGAEFLNAIESITKRFKGINTVCGLSNISYGLPVRKFLNQTFMIMAIAKGLSAAIVDPLDNRMMANIIAAETLAGRDEFCASYLEAYRENRIIF